MKIVWDDTGGRRYELGVGQGVLFLQNRNGTYAAGVPWNGLTAVTEASDGGDNNTMWADNIRYGRRRGPETFRATVEAYTYPDEFEECDGSRAVITGALVSQQEKKRFGFSYTTRVGNDVDGDDFGHKLHIVWNLSASATEKGYGTVNENPDAVTFSWDMTSDGVEAEGYDKVASITIDSTLVDPAKLAEIEKTLYGTDSTDPKLPTPEQVLAVFRYTDDDLTDSVNMTVLDNQNAAIRSRDLNF